MKTTQAVINKWPSILPMLGVGEHHLTGKHTACPICVDGGKDRFRFDNKEGRGTYFCSQCGAGDGFKLLNKLHGWDFKKSASEIDRVIGNAFSTPVKQPMDSNEAKKRLANQRSRIKQIGSDDGVSKYLMNRGISLATIEATNNSIGRIEKLQYWEDGQAAGLFDVMAAQVMLGDEVVTHHITYVDNGAKAHVSAPRKRMTPIRPSVGSAVRLFKHKSVLGVAEGIETALSAYQLFDIPTWAALDANSMRVIELPYGLKALHIFGDNDSNYVGQEATYALAKIASQRGLEVTTYIPPQTNTDWNDFLLCNPQVRMSQYEY